MSIYRYVAYSEFWFYTCMQPEIEFEPETAPESAGLLRSIVLGLVLIGAILRIGYTVKHAHR